MAWANVRFDFSGRHVLVTGGTSGIGHAIALGFREAGASVCITGTRAGAADYETDLAGMRYLQLDVTDNAQIADVAAAQHQLDILVNNAGGVQYTATATEEDPDLFERSLRVNLISAYRLSHACHNALTRSGDASIVSIASLTSIFGWEGIPGYGAAKAGLAQLTKTLALTWARDGIRVNAVAAGTTRSRMSAGMIDDPVAIAPYLKRIPMRRAGEAEDTAGMVLALCSGVAAWVTGQTVFVDGGYSVNGQPE